MILAKIPKIEVYKSSTRTSGDDPYGNGTVTTNNEFYPHKRG